VFFQDIISDSTTNESQPLWPTIYNLSLHPITQGITSYGYYGGCCLIATPPSTIVGRGDDDAASSQCPSLPGTLAASEASGRVVFSGDITPLHPSYYPENLRPEDELLLQNIANWLSGNLPTGTQSTSWGSVKASYSLP
jgi:hypothetical protein